ncbi:hypothetical protein PCANC_28326 [Puccinia coronata f. sp. avenae]|uniref:Uncharacterized protein n=2 Tax=Puccinia coronata f. sp. avenae TaxID=200324 RepID=A0A2N5TKP3_9BASI|nr:hypothetical protein PCANC_28326 [Puccinia coronata f. sp. avenae]
MLTWSKPAPCSTVHSTAPFLFAASSTIKLLLHVLMLVLMAQRSNSSWSKYSKPEAKLCVSVQSVVNIQQSDVTVIIHSQSPPN